jgi:hypothetical protein
MRKRSTRVEYTPVERRSTRPKPGRKRSMFIFTDSARLV